jgi:hypothetical protein
MSSAENPEGREHVGDEYVTYNRRRERRPRPDYPPFPPSSEEEEEAHREAERRAEHEAEREAERMMGDRYERPEGSGKAPMDPDATFMQVISNLVISQQAMTQSLAQMVDRLATGSTRAHKPHMQHRGTQGQEVDPIHLLAHTLLRVGFPGHYSPASRGHPQQQHNNHSTEAAHTGRGYCRV